MGINIRSKRILIPTLATAAVLVAGGVAWAELEDDEKLSGSQRDRAEQAALAEVEGGRVVEVEADDEGGQRQYELEVVDAEGVEWDIVLDENFDLVVADRDSDHHEAAEHDDDAEDTARDADDAPVSAADRERVGAAAVAAVPGGEAVDVDHGDAAGVAWEVEVIDGQGRDWDVTLDEQLTVLDAVRD